MATNISTPTQQRKCKMPTIAPALQPQPLASFKPLFLWIQALLRLFTTNSDPEWETAHLHTLSFLFSKCPSAACKNAVQREVRSEESGAGGQEALLPMELRSSFALFRSVLQTCRECLLCCYELSISHHQCNDARKLKQCWV